MSLSAIFATLISLLTAGLIAQVAVDPSPSPAPAFSPTPTPAEEQTPTVAGTITPAPTPTAAPTPDSTPGVESGSSAEVKSDNCDFEFHETYKNGEDVDIRHDCEKDLPGGGNVSNSVNVQAETSGTGEAYVDISVTTE